MRIIRNIVAHVRNPDGLSPSALVLAALTLAAVYGCSELLGLREFTAFLSGTPANLQMSWQAVAALGVIHMLSYFGFILVSPILLIAAALLAGRNRVTGG